MIVIMKDDRCNSVCENVFRRLRKKGRCCNFITQNGTHIRVPLEMRCWNLDDVFELWWDQP